MAALTAGQHGCFDGLVHELPRRIEAIFVCESRRGAVVLVPAETGLAACRAVADAVTGVPLALIVVLIEPGKLLPLSSLESGAEVAKFPPGTAVKVDDLVTEFTGDKAVADVYFSGDDGALSQTQVGTAAASALTAGGEARMLAFHPASSKIGAGRSKRLSCLTRAL